MPELEAAGYRWLRAQVFALWRYLAIFDVDGHELCRLDTQTDARIARTLNDATGEIEIECRIRGDDAEFTALLPVRVGATALFPDASGGDYRSRVTYSPAALTEATDGEILTHRVHVPLTLLSEVL